MKPLTLTVLWATLALAPTLHGQNLNKAMQLLTSGDFAKAHDALRKNAEKSETAVSYCLALLFSKRDPANTYFNTDSAYRYSHLAEKRYAQDEQEERDKLTKLSIKVTFDDILKAKQMVDSLGYEVAKEANTVEALQHFLDLHTNAPQRSQASTLRNELAFNATLATDTYDAYKAFIERYPSARQVPEAARLAEDALFRSVAQAGKLEDYLGYIEKYPKAPHRGAAEDSVLVLSTRGGTLTELHDFVKDYPNNRNAKRVWKEIYERETADLTAESIARFLGTYVEYPDKAQVRAELALARALLIPFKEEGKSGFLDAEGIIAIPPVYDDVRPFADYLAAARQGNTWGFITKRGKWHLEPTYASAGNFSEGRAAVGEPGKQGLIDKTGRLVLPASYDSVGTYVGGAVVVKDDGKMGYMDGAGRPLTPLQYEEAGQHLNGLARVKKDGKYGYVNAEGQETIACQYADALPFNGQVTAVKKDKAWGLINTEGQTVLPTEYTLIKPAEKGTWLVIKDKNYGIANAAGLLVLAVQNDLPPKDLPRTEATPEGYRVVSQNNLYGVMDSTGNWVVQPKYELCGLPGADLVGVRLNGKWGYVRLGADSVVVIPADFEEAWPFTGGLARVKKDGKYGYLAADGQVAVPVFYTQARDYHPMGYAAVERLGRWGLVNAQGGTALAMDLEKIEPTLHPDIMKATRAGRTAYFKLLPREVKMLWAEKGW